MSIFSIDNLADDVDAPPKLNIGDRALTHIGSHQSEYLHCLDYRLPAALYDGDRHPITSSLSGEIEFVLTDWQCARSHDMTANEGPLQSRRWPTVFPDHEINRVASFVADPGRHRAPAVVAPWQAGTLITDAKPIRLFIFDLTLSGALATPAAAQLQDRYPPRAELTLVLPTREAAAFGNETNRGTALSQFIDVLTVDELPARLADQREDAVIVMVAGGSVLTAAAFDEIDAVTAGTSIGAVGAIGHSGIAGPLSIDVVEDGEIALDLSESIGIFSAGATFRQIDMPYRVHEGVNIPLARLVEPQSKILAQRPAVSIARPNRYGFSCAIDAQSVSDIDGLVKILRLLGDAAIPTTLVGAPHIVDKIAGSGPLAGLKTLVAPSGNVSLQREIAVLRQGEASIILISADAISLSGDNFIDFIDLLEFAVGKTSTSSVCQLSLAVSDAGSPQNGTAKNSADFQCFKATPERTPSM